MMAIVGALIIVFWVIPFVLRCLSVLLLVGVAVAQTEVKPKGKPITASKETLNEASSAKSFANTYGKSM